jgi:integrase
MANYLTDAAVRKYRGGRRRREIRDGGAQGLYLIVQPSGAKSWALRYRRPGGRPAKLTLGSVDFSGQEPKDGPLLGAPLSLRAARALAAEQHRQRASGVDIAARHIAEKRRNARAVADAAANTFPARARLFVEEHAREHTVRWRATARMLGLDYPRDGGEPTALKGGLALRWHDRELRAITGDDIHGVVDEARQHGIPGLIRRRDGISNAQARAMAAALSSLFAWAKNRRHISTNPCLDLYKPPAPKARDRVLNVKADVRRADELRWFWSACGRVGSPYGILLKLLLLTGCRLDELASMRWEELNDDLSTLHLPGDRTKNGKSHDVHLAPSARALLAGVKQIDGCNHVFAGHGRKPISGWSKRKHDFDDTMLEVARSKRGADVTIEPWRLHDLRRSCATGMAGIGVAPHIIEACLNHISGAKASVAGTYNRETYEPEKRAAWQRWAAHVEALVSGAESSNIVAFPAAGA